MRVQLSFGETPVNPGKLLFSITIPGRLPSWNDILGMEQWARYQFKKELAAVFLSELRRIAADCSTKTTCAKNIWWTYVDTAVRYQAMQQEKRRLRSAKKKSAPTSQKKRSSKSFKPTEAPPF